MKDAFVAFRCYVPNTLKIFEDYTLCLLLMLILGVFLSFLRSPKYVFVNSFGPGLTYLFFSVKRTFIQLKELGQNHCCMHISYFSVIKNLSQTCLDILYPRIQPVDF